MQEAALTQVREICARHGDDRTRLMDIVREIQAALGSVPGAVQEEIARQCRTQRVEVQSVVTYYAFFSEQPRGRLVIRLCNDVVDMMRGMGATAAALEAELGIKMGQTTPDGLFTLEWTPCIGMSDQAPAGLVNDEVVTWFTPDKARRIVPVLRANPDPAALVRTYGDGHNAHPLVRSMVVNNVRRTGPVVLGEYHEGEGIRNALAMTPNEVVRAVKTARLRGRGGAGFPTGMKWDFLRQAPGRRRILICNADEGEPGTFKDRVLLTERPELFLEGMTIAAYATGADSGLLYLRAEYNYLRRYLESVLQSRRDKGLLGSGILGCRGFDFDIRIIMGAGAYVCGEETALISSCEGRRGDPKTRPPFPAQQGYLGLPTNVNNVETYCCIPGILEHGAAWFLQMGSKGSPGTKVLSIAGDVAMPGIYEFEFGVKLREVLAACGAQNPRAVLVGGPSGQLLGEACFDRSICYDDLGTGGALVVFGAERQLLDVVHRYLEFFCAESCGFCTPCRVGNVLMRKKLEDLLAGRGQAGDLEYLRRLGEMVKLTSRCGLGQTSPNPVLTSLANFPEEYARCLAAAPPAGDVFLPTFDIAAALSQGEALAGRPARLFAAPAEEAQA